MAAGKWIGGILGWMAGGPLGALAGLAIGAIFDYGLDDVNKQDSNSNQSTGRQYGQRSEEGQRNSFLFALLVLVSYVIKADGRVMHSEMEATRRFLRNNFGPEAQLQGEAILSRLFQEHNIRGRASFAATVADCCRQVADNIDRAQRLQLLSLLATVARADGTVSPEEAEAVRQCAVWMRLTVDDAEAALSLGGDTLADAYKVLGVQPTATNDEVRRAYRKLALEYHPDRVSALGEDVRKVAERKMQLINDAKERIYKARGM